MKKKLASVSVILFYFLINTFSQASYKLADKDFNFKEFPQVTFKLWSRSINEIETNRIHLKENDVSISSVSYQFIRDTTIKVPENKILFILIENHYLPKGVNERSFFRDILAHGLSGKIKRGDKIFIGMFDWYRNNKYLFLLNDSPIDDENEILRLINNISSPPALQNKQVGADIYFALDETLKFLSQIKDSLPKNILLFSDDFPNIAGQKTVDEIRTQSLKSDIPVYAIGYYVGADRYSQITKDEICLPTNGDYFISPSNDRNSSAEKVADFIEKMNRNSHGSTYLVTYTAKQKNAGQKVIISLDENENKLAEISVRYPFNLFQWIIANMLLSVFILISVIALSFGIYKFIKNREQLKIQNLIADQEKQLQIKNAENEIQRLKQQQISGERKLHEQKHQLEAEARLEKLRQLMKAKSLIPRINYDYNGQKGQFYVDSPVFAIGRDEKSNSFYLAAPSLSRNHAEIHFNETGQFLIKDLNSTNGVIVNGKRETSIVLKHGDIIKLGDVTLKVNL